MLSHGLAEGLIQTVSGALWFIGQLTKKRFCPEETTLTEPCDARAKFKLIALKNSA